MLLLHQLVYPRDRHHTRDTYMCTCLLFNSMQYALFDSGHISLINAVWRVVVNFMLHYPASLFGCAGATSEAIAAIPSHVVGSPGQSTDLDCKCPICLEHIVAGVTLRDLPCGHQFHKDCLDQWLQHKATCPICQRSYK